MVYPEWRPQLSYRNFARHRQHQSGPASRQRATIRLTRHDIYSLLFALALAQALLPLGNTGLRGLGGTVQIDEDTPVIAIAALLVVADPPQQHRAPPGLAGGTQRPAPLTVAIMRPVSARKGTLFRQDWPSKA